jgi:hypothetical protein
LIEVIRLDYVEEIQGSTSTLGQNLCGLHGNISIREKAMPNNNPLQCGHGVLLPGSLLSKWYKPLHGLRATLIPVRKRKFGGNSLYTFLFIRTEKGKVCRLEKAARKEENES